MKGTPLAYIIHDAPLQQTRVGKVQTGCPLTYQTRNTLTMEQSTSKGCSNPSVHNSPPIKLPTEFEDLNNGYKDIHPAAIEENTRAQSSSAEWFNARKCRLTESA